MTNSWLPYNFKPIHKLGQNFLISQEVLKQIIKSANLSKSDVVLEVGPGSGLLTVALALEAKEVIAVEKDSRLSQILKKNLADQKIANVKIINKDILKISNPRSLLPPNLKFKIIANLPYYITSPIIRKFLEMKKLPQLLILMVQKEVAQRITNQNKKSILSLSVALYAKAELITNVSKDFFWPKPKVDSAILKLTPYSEPQIKNRAEREKFFKLIKAGFSAKRKTLLNNLHSLFKQKGVDKKKIEEILKENKLDLKIRAEALSLSDWLNLLQALK